MSFFESIMNKIFHAAAPAAAQTPAAAADSKSQAGASSGQASAQAATAAPAASASAAGTSQPVDVEAVLAGMAAQKGGGGNWRTSIVDLLKLLDLDSSLAARKELAKELGYTGDTNDSASMNVWLHKQVMAKLAANGGKLPPEIKH